MDLLSRDDRRHIETHLGRLVDRVLGGCDESRAQARPGRGVEDANSDSPGGNSGPVTRSPLVETIRQFVLDGGKRVRPQLCLWAYQNARADVGRPGDAAPAVALDVACAWEVFHAFLLCHDDIIDGADRRRGRPTLHHRLASLDGGSVVFGSHLGIVAGDLLCVGAMRLLHGLDLDAAAGGGPPLSAKAYQHILRLFSRVACETGFGQAIDICQSHVPIGDVDEGLVLQGYHWKTAAYTFEGPMLSGALLAGLADAARPAVSRFALAVGQAYQLHNDLLDLRTTAHDGCDLVQGKRTPTLLRARQAMPPARRRAFDERVAAVAAGDGRAVALAEELRQELLADGAVGRTQAVVEQLLDEARRAAEDPALPPRFGGALAGLLAGMSARYFAPVLV